MNSKDHFGADLDALDEILDTGHTQKPAGPRLTVRTITTPGGHKPGRRSLRTPAGIAGAFILAAAALVGGIAIGGFGGGGSAQAASVTPVVYMGNPNCTVTTQAGAGLGYQFGYKPQPEPPPSGTYAFPDGINTVTISSDGTFFDWTSTIGIDAVIVKGGPNANVYTYDPEALSDTGLTTVAGGAISHIEFCFDYELDVTKSAETSFTRTYDWDIDKSVSPDEWDLFTGDSGTSDYAVKVTKGAGTDSGWAVSGEITIENNTPLAATITGVADSISGGVGAIAVSCPGGTSQTLAAGATLVCTYSSLLPDGTDRVNTATVTTSGSVGGGTATADVTFGDPTTEVNDTITVTDTLEGELGETSETKTFTYPRTFTCGDGEGEFEGLDNEVPNTASIVETGDEDDALVTVNCYELTVTKDADTTSTRTWVWTIEKSADETDLMLAEGQSFQVNYEVTVDATSTDSAFAVSGEITIANPAPIDADLTAVADIVSPDIAASVDCDSLTVPAGGSITCTYSADLPDAASRTNTAMATLQNYAYDSEGTAAPDGTTDFSGSADVTFGDPTTVTDECIDVTDTNLADPLGTVCAGDAPETFEYSLTFGTGEENDVVLECGTTQHINIADFVTNDTGTTGDDDHTIDITVSCEQLGGCTLTPGYWKTHNDSFHGGAPTDDTWEQILPSAEDSPFFLSGRSYFEVLWTPPQGNAYYNLSFHYIAAELNMLNGASVPADVQTAFDSATTLFNTYTPDQIADLKGKAGNELRAQFISLAGILGGYNEGSAGVPHCDEDSSSAG